MEAITRERQRRHEHQDLWDKFWKDKHGNVVIWQWPNVWLIGWAVATIISLFLNGKAATYVGYVGSVLLIVWSLLEIFKGVNYFRRALGLVVLALVIMTFFKVGL